MKNFVMSAPVLVAVLAACGGGTNTVHDAAVDDAHDAVATDGHTTTMDVAVDTTSGDSSSTDDVTTTDDVVGTDATVADAVTPTDAAVDATSDAGDAGRDAGDAGPGDAGSDAGTTMADTLFGAAFNPTDNAHFDEINGYFGPIRVRRTFDGSAGVMPFLSRIQAQDIARNAASAYSFKYPPSEVIAGTHDTELRSFFNGIANDHLTFWTYWHEPDDELYVDHTFTPTQYRDAWRHIRQIADQVRAMRPRLRMYATLIIMEYSLRANIAPNRPLLGTNGMYPGDDVIEVFGVDTYNSGAETGGIRDAATEFSNVINFAQAHGKPWAIGEIGSCPVMGNPQGRTTFLRNAIQYWISRHYPPMFVSYFDLDWSTCDYRIESDTPARTLWHDAVTMGLSAF